MRCDQSSEMSIALRFAENFAPDSGTISAHEKVIEEKGSVWYGKLGAPVSSKIAADILKAQNPKILLIHSGKQARYWGFIDSIQREIPDLNLVPSYYRNKAKKFGCWFHVNRIEKADSNIMSQYVVVSSGKVLSLASRQSMSPYFVIAPLESCSHEK